ncbi:MAG: TonB-dependent receptor, partial [Saprospiraceae bacterium]|nr:TonB-dependent receptor [Saprospiraceae bacterium]
TAIAAERPLVTSDFTYDINRPFQNIEHETFKLSANFIRDHRGKFHFNLSRQFNRRQEFDAHKPGGITSTDLTPEMEFELTTWNSQLYWEHRLFKHLSGQLGIQGTWQVNTTDRGGLIPDYQSLASGIYLVERWKKYPFPLEFEGALRFDWKQLDADFTNGDTFSRNFQNASGSLGILYYTKNNWQFSGNFSSTWRQPNVSELFSDGVHHGVAAVEFGDQNLNPETSLRTSIDVQYAPSKKLLLQLSLYSNYIRDFIYLNPQDRFELTIRGAFPVFAYEHTDANLSGLDFKSQFPVWKDFYGVADASVLRAKNIRDDNWLPLMPGDKYKLGIGYRFNQDKGFGKGQVETGFEHFLEQTRVPENADFAPPPGAYTLWYASASMEIPAGNNKLLLSIKGQNLGNIAYRNYLNRFRYFADDQGRNLILTIQYLF